MASVVDRAKEWWEGKAPRERRLLMVLAVTLGVCLIGGVGMTIHRGLAAIERKNDRTRDALSALEVQRMLKASRADSAPVVTVPDTPVPLDTYLDEIITAAGLKSPPYPTPKETAKGAYTELSFRITLQDLTIYQLKDVLQQIETKNPVVAVTELHVKNSFRDAEKLDVDLTVTTWYRKGAAGAAAGKAPAALPAGAPRPAGTGG